LRKQSNSKNQEKQKKLMKINEKTLSDRLKSSLRGGVKMVL